ncbi:MAG: hypothetical protein OEY28_13545, partial [Nitrospira sp.]|nr:hypothetical protein [Nitrospira sp.]
HLRALRGTCEKRELAGDPWLVLGLVEYAAGDYAAAEKALRHYRQVTPEPDVAALKLLEQAKNREK